MEWCTRGMAEFMRLESKGSGSDEAVEERTVMQRGMRRKPGITWQSDPLTAPSKGDGE